MVEKQKIAKDIFMTGVGSNAMGLLGMYGWMKRSLTFFGLLIQETPRNEDIVDFRKVKLKNY